MRHVGEQGAGLPAGKHCRAKNENRRRGWVCISLEDVVVSFECMKGTLILTFGSMHAAALPAE